MKNANHRLMILIILAILMTFLFSSCNTEINVAYPTEANTIESITLAPSVAERIANINNINIEEEYEADEYIAEIIDDIDHIDETEDIDEEHESTEEIIEPYIQQTQTEEDEEYIEEELEAELVTEYVYDETTETEVSEIVAPPVPLNIPIFMYHTSSEYNPGGLPELYVRPSEFARQIRHLVDNGYTFVTFDDWFNLHNIERPVFITFDDGYEANFTEIFPILQRYNARITLFLTLDNIVNENLTVEMIREMSDSGLVKFESHTISHPDLAAISGDEARLTRELRDSRDMIEEITGKPVLAIAYPGGRVNDRVIARAREYYMFGVRADGGMHNTDIDDFAIRRFRVSRSTSLNTFIAMLGS